MANDLNRCEFIGRLGRDPESRFSADGTQVVNFSIAVGRKYKEREETEWVNIVVFGKLGEICDQYLTKGAQVFIAGRMRTRKWQDKETGQDRYSTEIIADQMQMLGSKSEKPTDQSTNQTRPQTANTQAAGLENMDSDIPF